MIRRKGPKFEVVDEDGKSLGVFDTEEDAKKRDDAAKSKKNRQLDLGIDDVHKPGAGAAEKKRRSRYTKALRIRVGPDGSWNVRHGADADDSGGQRARAVELADAQSTEPRVWIQVAKVGQWAGHPAGPFKLGPQEFGEMVRNFRATANRRVPIDFEHASEQSATEGSIPVVGAPAQGWILDLDDRGADGLWGLVEWGDLAREYIRKGQYKYLSPAVRFESRDRVTGQRIGTRLTSAALTNQPFLDGMAQLVARDLMSSRLHSPSSYLPKLRDAMRVSLLAPAPEMQAQMVRLRGLAERATLENPVVDGVDLGEVMAGLAGALEAPVGTCVGELLDLVEALIQDAVDDAIEEHVEEMHPGEAAMTDVVAKTVDDENGSAGLGSGGGEGTTTMTDEAIKLRDAETRANTAELQLSEAKARVAKLEADNKVLLDAHEKREQEGREREVDEILASEFANAKSRLYKGLDKDKRPQLIKLLTDSPEAFRSLYPVAELRAAQAAGARAGSSHLFNDLATGPGAQTRDHQQPAGFDQQRPAAKPVKTVQELTDKYVRQGMPLEDAVIKATDKVRTRGYSAGKAG